MMMLIWSQWQFKYVLISVTEAVADHAQVAANIDQAGPSDDRTCCLIMGALVPARVAVANASDLTPTDSFE